MSETVGTPSRASQYGDTIADPTGAPASFLSDSADDDRESTWATALSKTVTCTTCNDDGLDTKCNNDLNGYCGENCEAPRRLKADREAAAPSHPGQEEGLSGRDSTGAGDR